jgi:CheY-like chemotaxis protein
VQAHRIVVADDNRDAAETLAELLRLSGHEVRCAVNGLQAMTLFHEFHPDVVVLDISMPLIDGREVARQIRAVDDHRHTLLIALSGWSRQCDREESIASGFDHYLVKPVDLETVNRLVTNQ